MAFDFIFDKTFEGNVSHTNIVGGFDTTFDATFESVEEVVIEIFDDIFIVDEVNILKDPIITITDGVSIEDSITGPTIIFVVNDSVSIEDDIDTVKQTIISIKDGVNIDDSMLIFSPGSGHIEKVKMDFKKNNAIIKFKQNTAIIKFR